MRRICEIQTSGVSHTFMELQLPDIYGRKTVLLMEIVVVANE
jgi:hypothetical protein